MRLIWTTLTWICGLVVFVWAIAMLVGWSWEHKLVAAGLTLTLLALGTLIVLYYTTE